MAKDAVVSYRIPGELKAALQKLADTDKRKLGPYIQIVLEEHVEQNVAKPQARGSRPSSEDQMNANVWLIVTVVLVVLSVILAIMDRSFLSPMYLLVLALVVIVGASVKFPW